MAAKRRISISTEGLKDGISLRTGHSYEIKVNNQTQIFCINLEIDPNDSASYDDKYTLYSTDEGQSYNQVRTIKDDKVPGDKRITLEYSDIIEELNYTLEIDPGIDGEKYNVFNNISLKDYLK